MALDTFTTQSLVRADAGFTNNTNVTDGVIEVYVAAANGEVSSALAGKYVLPLSGNDNYSGSLTESYLQQLTTNLGAGLLLLKQYEGQGGEMDDLAIAKIESSRSQIKEIVRGDRKLVGGDGVLLQTLSAGQTAISGYPNKDTVRTNRIDIEDRF